MLAAWSLWKSLLRSASFLLLLPALHVCDPLAAASLTAILLLFSLTAYHIYLNIYLFFCFLCLMPDSLGWKLIHITY